MTWGRTLWCLIGIKLFVFFVILRIFFFRPAMSGMSTEEKEQTVAGKLGASAPDTLDSKQ